MEGLPKDVAIHPAHRMFVHINPAHEKFFDPKEIAVGETVGRAAGGYFVLMVNVD